MYLGRVCSTMRRTGGRDEKMSTGQCAMTHLASGMHIRLHIHNIET